jgi:hypothetical protein
MSPAQATDFEGLVGDLLQELGYPLASEAWKPNHRAARLRTAYFAMFAAKHWARTNTPLGRFVRLERIEIRPNRSAPNQL